MRAVKWTAKALSDLERLYDFLVPANPPAARNAVRALVDLPLRLIDHPRLGERLYQFEGREVRRVMVGRYEIRYELQADSIIILRIWSTREDR